jgi:hypothetical protein
MKHGTFKQRMMNEKIFFRSTLTLTGSVRKKSGTTYPFGHIIIKQNRNYIKKFLSDMLHWKRIEMIN